MFLGQNVRSVVSIRKMSPGFKSITITNPKAAGFFN